MKIKSDERLNKTLQSEVAELRGGIVLQALKKQSDRFTGEPSGTSPELIITDNVTGNKTVVPLFASGNVLKALNELFPEIKKESDK